VYSLMEFRITNINIHYYQIPFVPLWVFSFYIFMSKLILGWHKSVYVTELGFDLYKRKDKSFFWTKLKKLENIAERWGVKYCFFYSYESIFKTEEKV
jgi:hypothetical protein